MYLPLSEIEAMVLLKAIKQAQKVEQQKRSEPGVARKPSDYERKLGRIRARLLRSVEE